MDLYRSTESESILKARGPHRQAVAAQTFDVAPTFVLDFGVTIDIGAYTVYGSQQDEGASLLDSQILPAKD